MTNYREILRLRGLGFSERNIAASCPCSRNTVSKVLKRADELGLSWPLPDEFTNKTLQDTLFPGRNQARSLSGKRMPDVDYVHRELLKNGVNKKLLWTEYLEECRLSNETPLMYSQFCYHIQQDEQKRRATMRIPRKPGEQVEVDWAGDPARIIDPDTGEVTDAWLFVGVMSYSQYTYAEAFVNEKQASWIAAHVHMYEYFGGVARILVSDNCATAVNLKKSGWYTKELNATYYEMAEHYGTAIIPARVRRPKDKPNAEGSVGVVSTWITAALRNERFFSIGELNIAIREKLRGFNEKPFQKKEDSRTRLFRQEELPLLAPLPAVPYEPAEWKQATVQFNYHISLDGMLYSVPFEYIRRKVDVRATEKTVEIFYNNHRVASHCRLYGRKNQYSTVTEHMPENHQKYLEWNGDRFREWAGRVGENTRRVVDAALASKRVEQQAYKSCMGILRLADKYTAARLEAACEKALRYTASPSYKSVKSILDIAGDNPNAEAVDEGTAKNSFGVIRGADYYRR